HRVVAGLENSGRSCGPRDLNGGAPFVGHNPLVQCLQKRAAGGPPPERQASAVLERKIVFLPGRERERKRQFRIDAKAKRCQDRPRTSRRSERHTEACLWGCV